jgi:hypothetical protein
LAALTYTSSSGQGLQVTYADAHKVRRNEGTVEFASKSDMEVRDVLHWADLCHGPSLGRRRWTSSTTRS